MQIQIFSTREAASRSAADRLMSCWRLNSNLLLCAATGNSPTLMYRFFVESVRNSARDATLPRLLKLDEWGGLAMDDPATCECYLQTHLISPLKLPVDRYVGFHGSPADPEAECARVARWLNENGPIDVCVLGLGRNGHLAMNEPGTDPATPCHVARLTQSTLEHPMLGPARGRPGFGLTIGLAEILAAREIVLLVFGKAKAGPLDRLFSTDGDLDFPASWLRRHPNASCLADTGAVSLISAERLESLGATSGPS